MESSQQNAGKLFDNRISGSKITSADAPDPKGEAMRRMRKDHLRGSQRRENPSASLVKDGQ